MAYIGKTPVIGNFVKLDAISVVNGQAAYTMQNGGVNFTSYDNVNQFLVSLNGILQSPTDSFTVSGSTLTFASNLSTGDVIDFVMVLGNTLDVGTPSDNTISTAKLQANAVTSAKMFSTFKNGITVADNWRLSADTNSGTNGYVTSNWERNDNASYGSIGTGLTESSGIFSFPTTGIYLINTHSSIVAVSGDTAVTLQLVTTVDNSTYPTAIDMRSGNPGSSTTICSASGSYLFDVTDISLCKFRFYTDTFNTGTYLRGNTGQNRTHFTVIRLGDT
jgi:hypothetical protein